MMPCGKRRPGDPDNTRTCRGFGWQRPSRFEWARICDAKKPWEACIVPALNSSIVTMSA